MGKKTEKIKTKQPWMCTIGGILLCAGICCALWGSAISVIKVGYSVLHINENETGNMLLFAGYRFMLAGFLALLMGRMLTKDRMMPKRSDWGMICQIALFQTFLQYAVYYPALSHIQGVTASVIIASGTFFSVLLACFCFRSENMTVRKLCGCAVGLAGVLLVSLAGASGFSFHLTGEGFILISTISASVSSNLVSIYGKRTSPVMLSGWQFVVGGAGITILGYLFGGNLRFNLLGFLIMIYLAFVSSVAYSLWGCLLKVNPVSRVMVFNFLTPVFGVLFSALFLGEIRSAFNFRTLTALILVCIGIVIVNRQKNLRTLKTRSGE